VNETELLFTEILNCNRLSLYQNKDLCLSTDKSSLIASVLKRRIRGEPIQYILGKTEFMGLEFRVSEFVFIPRPETEVLVEAVLQYVTRSPPGGGRQGHPLAGAGKVTRLNILDIGTGSGCIAVSLAKFLSDENITATDISQEALEVAEYNAKLNNLAKRIRFIQGDLFSQYAIRNTQYDIIISNPPYIPTADIQDLQLEIKYEPAVALDGGKYGLDFYRNIVTYAPNYLKVGGFLIMEMGFRQSKSIENIFKKSENFEIIEVIKDYNDIDRVIVAQRKAQN